MTNGSNTSAGAERSCADCGRPTAGYRCRVCHGTELKRLSAVAHQQEDAALIALIEREGLNPTTLGERLGISRQRAGIKLNKARRRTALLVAGGAMERGA